MKVKYRSYCKRGADSDFWVEECMSRYTGEQGILVSGGGKAPREFVHPSYAVAYLSDQREKEGRKVPNLVIAKLRERALEQDGLL